MAKTKPASKFQKENPPQNQVGFVTVLPEVNPAMDSEASEKQLRNLKSLNQRLLSETVESRKQMESLLKSKGSLETELTRLNSERDDLKSDLTRLMDRAERLELERWVVEVFIDCQLRLKGEELERKINGLLMENRALKGKDSEIRGLNEKLSVVEGVLENEREVSRRTVVERDELKDKLYLQIEESKGLRADFIESKDEKRKIERELVELRVSYDAAAREKEEQQITMEFIMNEKGSIERCLLESNKSREKMEEELHRVVVEKKGIEELKQEEMVKRKELEIALRGLNEIIVGLKNEEEKLRTKTVDLETLNAEGDERQMEMRNDIDQLVEARKFSDNQISALLDEKTVIEQYLCRATKELDAQKVKLEELINEKDAVLVAKMRLHDEVEVLHMRVAELEAIVSKLEESSVVELEKIRSLESEAGEYKLKFDKVKVERAELENHVNEEKENGVRLKEVIGKLGIKIEESLEAMEAAKAEREATFAAKAGLESECGMLKEKISVQESTITEMRNEYDLMKGRFESADGNLQLVLNMLKETSSFCCDENDGRDCDFVGDKHVNGEANMYVMEMSTIKNAFKSEVRKVQSMSREMELLQSSVDEAQKKKSFWTMLSSATTVLAAISLAYVARGR